MPASTCRTRAAPRMGEHNDAMLREAGFDAAAIAKLRELGVIARRTSAPAGVEHDAGHDVGHAA